MARIRLLTCWSCGYTATDGYFKNGICPDCGADVGLGAHARWKQVKKEDLPAVRPVALVWDG